MLALVSLADALGYSDARVTGDIVKACFASTSPPVPLKPISIASTSPVVNHAAAATSAAE
ncbi:MAG: hypothetical protein QM754_12030 [Tepidisphaeraceae bacterium]